jgi:ABC-type nitrate/sulfonate/bicarbonate transport system substrate-binding protein
MIKIGVMVVVAVLWHGPAAGGRVLLSRSLPHKNYTAKERKRKTLTFTPHSSSLALLLFWLPC